MNWLSLTQATQGQWRSRNRSAGKSLVTFTSGVANTGSTLKWKWCSVPGYQPLGMHPFKKTAAEKLSADWTQERILGRTDPGNSPAHPGP